MSTFVEECRREWKRLGVPDLIADEMAADLSADLEEAQADGVAPEEILGDGAADPRSFAATWANARGVAAPGQRRQRRRAGWRVWLAAGLLLGLALVGVLVSVFAVSSTHRASTSTVIAATAPTTVGVGRKVPDLVGLTEAEAVAAARRAGFRTRIVHMLAATQLGTVIDQSPTAGDSAAEGTRITLSVATLPHP